MVGTFAVAAVGHQRHAVDFVQVETVEVLEAGADVALLRDPVARMRRIMMPPSWIT